MFANAPLVRGPAAPMPGAAGRACVGLGRDGCCARPRGAVRDFATFGVRAVIGAAPGKRVCAGRAALHATQARGIPASLRGGSNEGQGWALSQGRTITLAFSSRIPSLARAK